MIQFNCINYKPFLIPLRKCKWKLQFLSKRFKIFFKYLLPLPFSDISNKLNINHISPATFHNSNHLMYKILTMPPQLFLRHKKWLPTYLCHKLEILHLRINMRVSSFLQFRHLYFLCLFQDVTIALIFV